MAPEITPINIIDQDVDEGRIFSKYDGRNVYSTLVLFHEEYVTQKMYDNFRRFVNNWGTIIFMDSNFFIAEVNHNKLENTVTLAKGHAWEFDGKSAKKSIPERWFNETKESVGSNFVNRAIADDIYFLNNPFNYTHFERITSITQMQSFFWTTKRDFPTMTSTIITPKSLRVQWELVKGRRSFSEYIQKIF